MATLRYDGREYAVSNYSGNDLRELVTNKLDDPSHHEGSWLTFYEGDQFVALLLRQGIAVAVLD